MHQLMIQFLTSNQTTHMKKYDKIMNNYINGSQSDFRTGLRGLSKIGLLDFIEYVQANYPEYPRYATINACRSHLAVRIN